MTEPNPYQPPENLTEPIKAIERDETVESALVVGKWTLFGFAFFLIGLSALQIDWPDRRLVVPIIFFFWQITAFCLFIAVKKSPA